MGPGTLFHSSLGDRPHRPSPQKGIDHKRVPVPLVWPQPALPTAKPPTENDDPTAAGEKPG